jgi:hypothetical protein
MISSPTQVRQDALLKQLEELHYDERRGIVPERASINRIILILMLFMAAVFVVLKIFERDFELILIILVSMILVSVPLFAAMKNRRWGLYTVAITSGIVTVITTLTEPNYYSPIVSFCDGFFLFLIVNQLGKKGFYIITPIFLLKSILIFVLFNANQDIGYFLISLVNILALGSIPLIIQVASTATRRAKISELKAELLALQNADLLDHWTESNVKK